MKNTGVTNEKIMSYLVDMQGQITDIRIHMATKDDLEVMKADIVNPIIKAVDKDAETIVDHERRITALERRTKRRFSR